MPWRAFVVFLPGLEITPEFEDYLSQCPGGHLLFFYQVWRSLRSSRTICLNALAEGWIDGLFYYA